jgi:hypothetical protein
MTSDSALDEDLDVEELRQESIGALLSRLSNDSSLLVRQEIALAQAELKEKAVAAGTGAGLLGLALVLLLAVLGAGTTAAVAGFRNLLPLWAAALCAMGAVMTVAALLALVGVGRLKRALPPAPERAIQTLKETPHELVH